MGKTNIGTRRITYPSICGEHKKNASCLENCHQSKGFQFDARDSVQLIWKDWETFVGCWQHPKRLFVFLCQGQGLQRNKGTMNKELKASGWFSWRAVCLCISCMFFFVYELSSWSKSEKNFGQAIFWDNFRQFQEPVMFWVVVSNIQILYFSPYLGKWSNLTYIFQMGWNHQLVFCVVLYQIVFVERCISDRARTQCADFAAKSAGFWAWVMKFDT